jgi:hypothetical protein
MGLMVRFLQELNLYSLKVEFADAFPMTVNEIPIKFAFEEITLSKQKDQNQGLVNCAMQGYLYSKKNQLMEYWKIMMNENVWESHFYVLTNVGILVFKEDNFMNPTRLIPLGKLGVAKVGRKVAGRDYLFKLLISNGQEEIMLGAPDQEQYEQWTSALTNLIDTARKSPNKFKF